MEDEGSKKVRGKISGLSNAFKVSWRSSDRRVFEYKVRFVDQVGVELSSCCSCLKPARRLYLTRLLFQELCDLASDWFEDMDVDFVTYDNMDTFYTEQPLDLTGETEVQILSPSITHDLFQTTQPIFGQVQFVQEFDVTTDDRSTERFLQALTWQNFADVKCGEEESDVLLLRDRAYFPLDDEQKLESHELFEDVSCLKKSIQRVSETMWLMKLRPAIDHLYPPHASVFVLLAKFSSLLGAKLVHFVEKNRANIDKALLNVRVRNVVTNQRLLIKKLGRNVHEEFTDTNRTVFQRFEAVGLRMARTEMAVECEDVGGHLQMHPMCVLVFEAGQSLSGDALSFFKVKPVPARIAAFDSLVIRNVPFERDQVDENSYLRRFNVTVGVDVLKPLVSRIQAPQLVFPNESVAIDPDLDLCWLNTADVLRFHKPASDADLKWAIVVFGHSLDERQVGILSQSLFFKAKTARGPNAVPIPPAVVVRNPHGAHLNAQCRAALDQVRTAGCTFLLYATMDGDNRVTRFMNLLEVQFGILTVGIQGQKIIKNQASRRKWRPALRQRINVKMGGVNFDLTPTNKAYFENRMFMGLKVLDVDEAIKAVGLAYTTTPDLLIRGECQFYTGRSCGLADAIQLAFDTYNNMNNKPPSGLVLYAEAGSEHLVEQILDQVSADMPHTTVTVLTRRLENHWILLRTQLDQHSSSTENLFGACGVTYRDLGLPGDGFFLKAQALKTAPTTIHDLDEYAVQGAPCQSTDDLLHLTYVLTCVDPVERRVTRLPYVLTAAHRYASRAKSNYETISALLHKHQLTADECSFEDTDSAHTRAAKANDSLRPIGMDTFYTCDHQLV